MAWPNKATVSAKDILGMEAEELKTKLDSAASKDDVKAATDAVEGLKGTIGELQAALAKLTTPTPQPDPNIQADVNDPTTQILTDPAAYIGRQTAGMGQVALKTAADVNEMRARQKYAGAFQQYGAELMKDLDKAPLAMRAGEGFWDFRIQLVVGEKALKGELESGYPSLLGNSGFAPDSTGNVKDPNRGFTADQAAFLKGKVPLEKAEGIRKMLEAGESITAENMKRFVNA